MRTTICVGLLTAVLAVSGCSSDTPSTPTPSGPPAVLTKVEPASAAVGDSLTLTGSGFTATGNSVKIGDGYLHNIPSGDTKALTFVLRGNLGACPPTVSVCTQQALSLVPGTYMLAVVNVNGTSNEVSFEVTASK